MNMMRADEGRNLKQSGSFRAFTYLSLFGLAITVPLLLLFGALLLFGVIKLEPEVHHHQTQASPSPLGEAPESVNPSSDPKRR